MSLYEYFQLQPIEPKDDGSISELDQYKPDDVFDLSRDEDAETLMEKLDEMSREMHGSSGEL